MSVRLFFSSVNTSMIGSGTDMILLIKYRHEGGFIIIIILLFYCLFPCKMGSAAMTRQLSSRKSGKQFLSTPKKIIAKKTQ